MPDVAIRPLSGAEELPLFLRLSYVLDEELADDLAEGRRRPGWMWVATRGDHLLARAGWWGRAGSAAPEAFDILDVDDRLDAAEAHEIAERLLRIALAAVVPAGTTPPEYGRFLPADWHEDPEARRAIAARMAVVEAVGGVPLVERLRLEWRPGSPVPADGERLRFRAVAGRDELVGLMEQVLGGTLDAHSRADLEQMTAADAAAQHFDDEFAGFRSPREWWRIGTLDDGTAVGFVIPGRNDYGAIMAYLGVVPAHRGNGYIDDLLGEGTRILAAEGVPRIRASTDLGNVPMARAFERAGYVNFERVINMTFRHEKAPI